jgi:hypothetical protein
MRGDAQNKMQAPELCPQCGRATAEFGCRKVAMGDFCLQWGLKYSQAAMVVPTPDPRYVNVQNDKQVLATAQAEADAVQKYNQAHDMWMASLGELSAVRLRASQDTGSLDARTGAYTPPNRSELAALEIRLSAEAEQLGRARERASEELTEARVAHRLATDRACQRNGLAVMNTNQAPEGTRTITTY